MSAKHRISFNLRKPFTILGVTLDELFISVGGFSFFFFSKYKVMGSIIFGLSMVTVIGIRQFKKRTIGFNLKSYLWWKLGVGSKHYTQPPSSTRRVG